MGAVTPWCLPHLLAPCLVVFTGPRLTFNLLPRAPNTGSDVNNENIQKEVMERPVKVLMSGK